MAAAMGHDKDMFLTMAVPVLETILTVLPPPNLHHPQHPHPTPPHSHHSLYPTHTPALTLTTIFLSYPRCGKLLTMVILVPYVPLTPTHLPSNHFPSALYPLSSTLP